MLGASFGDDGHVVRYASDAGRRLRPGTDTLVADLSHMHTLLFSGPAASSFVGASFAGRQLASGECSVEAVLTGDGSVVSCPLLIRTGDQEYVACDPSGRSEVLSGWLSFVAAMEQDGFAPYAELDLDDATGTHCVLLLAGCHAKEVIGDYVKDDSALPEEGTVRSCKLDSFPCVVARPSLSSGPAYLVFAPPTCAVPLWRSFLSFPEVTPAGYETLREISHELASWTRKLDETDAVRLERSTLVKCGLLRNTSDFIGARGIA